MNNTEEFVNPEVLRSRLLAASLYIAAFELLEDSVVNRIRDFYMASPEYKGYFSAYKTHFREYEAEVLDKDPKKKGRPVFASLAWLKESEAISDGDTEIFEKLKRLRDEVVHELGRTIVGGLPASFAERFTEALSLLEKIERWWIKNVECATNPQLRGKDIDEAAMLPGPVMMLRLMVNIALAPDEVSKGYWCEFLSRARKPYSGERPQ